MDLSDLTPAPGRVFGEPTVTPDGTTVIPVARVRRRGRGERARVCARPLGLYVVKDGAVRWEPAVDATRIALLGELIGLIAATLGAAALLRRPPWPDLRIGGFSPDGRTPAGQDGSA
ncbi:hypothetical protein [uncultured Mycolicibacterium sp.]|uniref:hypothetical protein n=1 Tax=uncultured Mycolicibacterium sp. TaxID=2320817 RepID=UPI0026034D2D|nr:hypothetical protein [uncultured Mycolicibacterium sp.]